MLSVMWTKLLKDVCRLSVTLRYCVKTAKHIVENFFYHLSYLNYTVFLRSDEVLNAGVI